MTWNRALVTGASSGIGLEFARQLADEGSHLVLVARSTDTLQELAEELADAHGVEVEVLPADLTDPDQLDTVEQRISDLDSPIDLVINNAGFGTFGPFHRLDVDREEAIVELNVVALTRLTHVAANVMTARGTGAIINVSSLASFQPVPTNATYAASKAYVTSFTEAVHEELRGTGVHVSALCPGFTRTNFAEVADVDDTASKLPDAVWMSPGAVVREGLEGARRNKAVVVAGLANKVGAAVSTLLPNALVRRTINATVERM